MSMFSSIPPQENDQPLPTKHVNFTLGMVLGVDEFVQEFAYLSNRDQWMTRDLHGYGTASGLKVSTREETGEHGGTIAWLQVSAGSAVSPRGQLIRVPGGQCANLNDWLGKQDPATIETKRDPVAGKLLLYLVLSYRDRPTDDVPIPGELSPSEDDLTAPSRLMDDFVLELSLDPPAQCEEDALRTYVRWLAGQVRITKDATDPGLDTATFRQAIRDAVQIASQPCPVRDFAIAAPPAAFTINAAEACKYLNAAFLLWVTEFRPLWTANPSGAGPGCGEPALPPEAGKGSLEDRVLLAMLDVPVTGGKVSGAVTVIEDNRPYLLHSRMLQEWLVCRGGAQVGSEPPGGSGSTPPTPAQNDLVAAGTLRSRDCTGENTINKLRTAGIRKGEIVFTFDGYRMPDASTHYTIRSAIMAGPGMKLPVPTVRVKEFRPEGFALSVTRGATLLTITEIRQIEFVIEVYR